MNFTAQIIKLSSAEVYTTMHCILKQEMGQYATPVTQVSVSIDNNQT